jgi:hypothetical protein
MTDDQCIADPYMLAPDAFCPHCGVKGRLVEEQYDEECDCATSRGHLRTCVECGHAHERSFEGDDIKAMRIQFGRLIEGRPYEPPAPPEFKPIVTPPGWAEAFDKMLKGYYSLGSGPGYNARVDMCAPTQFKAPVRIDAKGATELKVSTWVMPSEEVSGIGAWIPSKPHRVGCGFPGPSCDCEDEA